MSLESGRKRRLIRVRVRGRWEYVTEFHIMPNAAVILDRPEGKLVIPQPDWEYVDPLAPDPRETRAVGGAVGHSDVNELNREHLPNCRCEACARRRRREKGNNLSARDQFEQLVLGFLAVVFVAFVAMVLWGFVSQRPTPPSTAPAAADSPLGDG